MSRYGNSWYFLEPVTTHRLISWLREPWAFGHVHRIMFWFFPDNELKVYHQPPLSDIEAWFQRVQLVPKSCMPENQQLQNHLAAASSTGRAKTDDLTADANASYGQQLLLPPSICKGASCHMLSLSGDTFFFGGSPHGYAPPVEGLIPASLSWVSSELDRLLYRSCPL